MSKQLTVVSTTDSPEEMQEALGGREGRVAEDKDPTARPEYKEVPAEGDAPTADTTRPDAGNPDDTQSVATDGEPESGGESEAPDDESEPESGKPQRKRVSGAQKRINELTRERYEQEARANAAEEIARKAQQDLAALQAQLEGKTPVPEAEQPAPTQPDTTAPDLGPKPKPTEFPSYDAYLEALSDWKVAGKAAELEAKYQGQIDQMRTDLSERESQRQAEEQRQAAQQRWQAAEATARSKYEDYDTVVQSDLRVSKPVSEVVMASDIGPELVYHLGANPDVAARLSAIQSPVEVALEMGKIIASLSSGSSPSGDGGSMTVVQGQRTPDNQRTARPAQPNRPIKPVGTNVGSTSYNFETMSQQEYNRLRNEGKI